MAQQEAYSVKNEKIRPEDRALCAAFKSAKGFDEDRRMSSCGLGWFAEFAQESAGLSREEAHDLAMRVYFDEHPHEAGLYDMLAGSAGTDIKTAVGHLSAKFAIPEKVARDAVRNAFGGANAFAILDGDFKLRLLKKGEPVGYWP